LIEIGPDALLLVGLALAFAWSIGAHYSGACMGMAYAAGAISRRNALAWMAVLTFVGAAVASGRVVENVGLDLVPDASLSVLAASVVVGVAFALTTAYNQLRLPTSTIQILVFSLLGVALARGILVHYATLTGLVVVWAAAPLAALGLGFVYTKGLSGGQVAVNAAPVSPSRADSTARVLVATALVASFAMGANDVANATAVFVAVHLTDVAVAGAIGGVALAVGVLTWGGPLLTTVAFDIVRLDRRMAASAQFAQATVVLVAVAFLGAFTSMNQALVGGMAGAGLARGRATIRWETVRGILLGWAIGPLSGLGVGYAAWSLARLAGLGP